MSVIHLTAEQLPKVLEAHSKKLPQAFKTGAKLAAQRGRTLLMRESPVDLGQFKNSWRVTDQGFGPSIVNDAPHAGIIEHGARPHGVNREGIEALTRWAYRKLRAGILVSRSKTPIKLYKNQYGSFPARANRNLLEKEARGIAFAIAAKLKKEGQKGLHLVANNMPKIMKLLEQEVARQVLKVLKDKGF